jgi:hypothetical protein
MNVLLFLLLLELPGTLSVWLELSRSVISVFEGTALYEQ